MEYKRKNSLRGEAFDFSQPAFYLITVTVQNRKKILGEVKDGQFIPNELGELVNKIWQQIPEHFPYTKLHRHQVMPDHFHGIVEIIYGNPNPLFVSYMINQFKGTVSREAKFLNLKISFPIWQRSFWCKAFWMHDDLCKIEKYIADNPQKWKISKSKVNSSSSFSSSKSSASLKPADMPNRSWKKAA